MAGLASSLTAVGAALEQGTRLQLSWVRTDVNGTTTQGENLQNLKSKMLLSSNDIQIVHAQSCILCRCAEG